MRSIKSILNVPVVGALIVFALLLALNLNSNAPSDEEDYKGHWKSLNEMQDKYPQASLEYILFLDAERYLKKEIAMGRAYFVALYMSLLASCIFLFYIGFSEIPDLESKARRREKLLKEISTANAWALETVYEKLGEIYGWKEEKIQVLREMIDTETDEFLNSPELDNWTK